MKTVHVPFWPTLISILLIAVLTFSLVGKVADQQHELDRLVDTARDQRIDSLRSNYVERVRCDDFDWAQQYGGGGWIECDVNGELIRILCDRFKTRTNDHNDQDVICTHDGDTHLFYRMPKAAIPSPSSR